MQKFISVFCFLISTLHVHAQAILIDSNQYWKHHLTAYHGNAYMSVSSMDSSLSRRPAKVDGNTGVMTILDSTVSTPYLFGVGSYVYFIGEDSVTNDAELWRTDGIPQGTFRLKDINPSGRSLHNGFPWTPGRDGIVFEAYDGDSYGLWTTDGTTAGTIQLVDFASYSPLISCLYLQELNGKIIVLSAPILGQVGLYSNAYVYDNGILSQINGAPFDGIANGYTDVVQVGASLYMSCLGSNVSTKIIKVNVDTAFVAYDDPTSLIYAISSLRDSLLLGISSEINMDGLYITDTLFTSLTLVQDLDNVSGLGNPPAVTDMLRVQDSVFFIGIDLAHGNELWRTDGTPAGTYVVRDIDQGLGNGIRYPYMLNKSNDNIYNFGYSSSTAPRLDTSCNRVFFQAIANSLQAAPWCTNGSALGTMPTFQPLASITTNATIPPLYFTQMSVTDHKLFIITGPGSAGVGMGGYACNGLDYLWMINTCDSFPQVPLPPPLSIAETCNGHLVKLYPNPAETEIHISGMDATYAVITNAIGQKQITSLKNNILNISHLSSGIYYLTTGNTSGNRKTISFTKK